MDLLSLQYILFVVICLAAYYLPGRPLRRPEGAAGQVREAVEGTPGSSRLLPGWVILLAASMGFYLTMGRIHVLFLLTTAFSVWFGGLRMGQLQDRYGQTIRSGGDNGAGLSREDKKHLKARTAAARRRVLLAVLVVNFGILVWLKYWNVIAGAIGAGRISGLLLPLGISFYTFQATGYLLDVYGGKYAPEKNFFRFLLFVSWFPQLLQGPIGRYDQLAPQLLQEHAWDSRRSAQAVHS